MSETTTQKARRIAAWHDHEAGCWRCDGGNTPLARQHDEAAATLRALLADLDAAREALGLALAILHGNEPPDSRFVSAEFVAMAAVHCGIGGPADVAVIRAALARLEGTP
jgi:hypothetical protein